MDRFADAWNEGADRRESRYVCPKPDEIEEMTLEELTDYFKRVWARTELCSCPQCVNGEGYTDDLDEVWS